MLDLEQRVIIDFFSKNVNIDFNNEVCISKERLLELLIKHRVFLLFYNELSSDEKQKFNNNYKVTNYQLVKKKKKYYAFLKQFISFLNNIKINYILLKGIANEIIIYGKLFTRVYGDIDVMINECDQKYLIDELSKAGYDITVNEYDDYYSHEMLINIKDGNDIYLVELKRRHRESNFEYTDYYFLNHKSIVWDNIQIPVLSNEALFLSSCIYIYNYIERIAGWLSSKKIRFCYFLDLYNFILKYKKKLNFELIIKESIKQKNIHKIILIIKHLYKLFNDDVVYSIYILLKTRYTYYDHIDYFDIGRINWNISIQDRIFNYEEISKIVEKFLYGKFFLNDKLYIGKQKHQIYSPEYDINFFYDISLSNNILKLNLSDLKIPTNGEYVIYLSLYCYDKYGDYIAPYLPISIRFLNNYEVKIFNRFTVDFSCGIYKFESEKLMPYQDSDTFKLIIDKKDLELSIDLIKLGVIARSLGDLSYQIELIHIKDNHSIFVISRTNDEKDLPLKFEY